VCGIIGGVRKDDLQNKLPDTNGALNALFHRGPDDRGMWEDLIDSFQVTLGHTRLSIIDLSNGGHQPMVSRDGRYILVFNGEIYNYKALRSELENLDIDFLSNSDSEVLLSAWMTWGRECIDRLDGMFAFAVLDRKEKTVTCVRDAFGIKPLYVMSSGDNFAFGSEIRALLTYGGLTPKLSLEAIYAYLIWGNHDFGVGTMYKDVHQLLPGHLMEVSFARSLSLNTEKWWNPETEEALDCNYEDASDQIRQLFLSSVGYQLQSDVPVGFSLSGGLDSSAIICAAVHLEPDREFKAFTYSSELKEIDELPWVDKLRLPSNVERHTIRLSSERFQEDLVEVIKFQGEPFGGPSIFAQYSIYKAAHRSGMKVLLDGQGGDEVFGGYEGYPGTIMKSWIRQRNLRDSFLFQRNWPKGPDRSSRELWIDTARETLPARLQLVLSRSASRVQNWQCLKDPEQFFTRRPSDAIGKQRAPGNRFLAQKLAGEQSTGRLMRLLRYSDRNAMAWSIENRVPFLSPELVKFCLQLPESFLISPMGETKHIFRHAMRGIVPNEVLSRPDKLGFEIPKRPWLKALVQDKGSWLPELLELPFVHPKELLQLISDVETNDHLNGSVLWPWINLSYWISSHESYSFE
jgi:asparagine synthase (glutamine-hydrolysing)